ncbi:adenosylcobinamide-GDP ribazoletransferase [Amaricoccus macauensis]|uniref:Adenosylcobinamide-GDP ribazoletransferase n=1 Tax=Amaricoccus macauensis TaxID=57001 RepID=A0A840SKQ6_9RHOB|nr:adenosylcobinamide-GDP ribazoletransferase [Amaricoccus macauensis]MBB5220466.1 adenosylcobinamide-GDP ribazoletransferase [Amaricoccus macauensis]
MSRLREEAAALALAWQFLTRVPLPVAVTYTPERMAASQAWLPAVGLGIGVIGAAVLVAAAVVLPAVPAVLLSIAATVALTGAFHEDGLADTFDGVGGGPDITRRLTIMKDSRIGTYGAVGLGLVLALKASSLAGLGPVGSPCLVAATLVAGHGASRASAMLVVMTSGYVRDDGTGKFTARGLGRRGVVLVGAVGLAALLILFAAAGAGAAAAGLAGLMAGHLLARSLFERQLGGYTGDCLGATQQLSEVGLYLGLLAWI